MNMPSLGGNFNGPVTMSSREIAELYEKRHDHVLRDIEKMLQDIDAPNFGAVDFEAKYQDAKGEWRKEYRLPKDLTVTLITGYRADLRYKVVKRLEELEGQSRLPDLSDPAVLVQLLTEHASKRIEAEQRAAAAEAQVEAVKPKAEFFDQFVSADGLYGLQNAARVLSEPPNKFVGWLKQSFLFYQGGSLVPRAVYREQGLFEVKATIIEEKARYRTYVTPKGLRYLAKKLDKPADLFSVLQ